MAKPNMKFIATTKEKLDTIEKQAGQLIFVIDDRAIYLDISDNQRTTYQNIISVIDDETRQNIISPINGFYYVRKENTLWNFFDGKWTQIINENSNLIFSDDKLPDIGIRNSLYIQNNNIFRWNDSLKKYEMINSTVDWEII